MMRRLAFICVFMSCLAGLSLRQAGAKTITFEQLRELAGKGRREIVDVHVNRVPGETSVCRYVTEIKDKLYLSGLVAGAPQYPRHANLEMPYNTASYEIQVNPALGTCYLQSVDGRYGVKLRFRNEAAGRCLKPFGLAEINLRGTTLIKEGNSYVIDGCKPENVVYSEPGVVEDMPKKEKYVSELTDDDLYTYVTIKDCEFVFKGGAFGNMIEESLTRSAAGRNLGAGCADGWQSLIMDGKGDLIFFHVNTKMTNRRIGGGLPQGCGSLSGILVDSYNPRYGSSDVKYGIRPHSDLDVAMDWMGTPGYKTIAAWDWNRNQTVGFFPAEYGLGQMMTDFSVEVRRVNDYDNPMIDIVKDKKEDTRGLNGSVVNGAMQLVAPTCSWWDWEKDCGRGLVLVCSTLHAQGDEMFLAFSMTAGNRTTDTSYGYPSYWKVQWSLDGANYTDVEAQDVNIRSLYHDWFGSAPKVVDEEWYELSYEAAIGMAEHLVRLPSHLLGQKRVCLRITPARKVVASVGYLGRDNVTLRPNMTENCYINFGEVIIGYR